VPAPLVFGHPSLNGLVLTTTSSVGFLAIVIVLLLVAKFLMIWISLKFVPLITPLLMPSSTTLTTTLFLSSFGILANPVNLDAFLLLFGLFPTLESFVVIFLIVVSVSLVVMFTPLTILSLLFQASLLRLFEFFSSPLCFVLLSAHRDFYLVTRLRILTSAYVAFLVS
jgi:hypothetical protein